MQSIFQVKCSKQIITLILSFKNKFKLVNSNITCLQGEAWKTLQQNKLEILPSSSFLD